MTILPGDPMFRTLDRWHGQAIEARLALRIERDHPDTGADDPRVRGRAARMRGHARAAVRHYEEALRVAPRHPALTRELALALRDVGEFVRAIALLRQVVDSGRASVELLVELADLQRTARALREAEETIARALMIAPRDVEARLSRAHLLAARGQTLQAASAYGDICRDAPGHARAWRHRGLHAQHASELRDARRWLARSLELDAAHSMTWYALGRVCAALGLTMRAVDCYDRALSLNADAELVASARQRLCLTATIAGIQAASTCTQRVSALS